MELLAIVAAIWGGLWTLNSAISAFLQTKWMYDQRNTQREILAYLQILVGDDLRKAGSVGGVNLPTFSHSCNLPDCDTCGNQTVKTVTEDICTDSECSCYTPEPQVTEKAECDNCGLRLADCECFLEEDGPYDSLDPID